MFGEKKIYRMALSFLLFLWARSYSAITISGEPDTQGQPFPFAVKEHVTDQHFRRFYIASHEHITDERYKDIAISVVGSGNESVVPVTPALTTLNNIEDQDNPLYGQQIDFLALTDASLIAVTHANPAVIEAVINPALVSRIGLESDPLQDANGSESAGVFGLSGLTLEYMEKPTFFATVKPNGGLFGQNGSGLVCGYIERTYNEISKKTEYSLAFEDTIALDTTSAALKVGSNLASIDNEAEGQPVAMTTSERLSTVFAGLLVTGGAGAQDGARAVTFGGVLPITPDAAIEADSIIGGRGTDVRVSIHHVGVLYTSTRVDYLVVVGGVGTPTATKRSVYALPLVGPKGAYAGMLAKKNDEPVTFVSDGINSLFLDRSFVQPATAAGDLFSPAADDIYKARVGGTVQLPGDISEIWADKDAVFVAIGQESTNEQAGVFYSQAIFNSLGAIVGWTDWARAVGSTDKIFGLGLGRSLGRFWFMPGDTALTVTTLKRNVWDEGSGAFDQKFNEFFEDLNSGVQGLFDFPKNHPAFSQTAGQRISVMCATGYKRVVLTQSGADDGVQFKPTDISTTFTSTDGSLTGLTTPIDSLVISGGDLDDIGPIIAAEIVSDGTYDWLMVGGSHGVAVLANDDGTGWAHGQLQAGFVGLQNTMSFKKLGSVQQVRKIIADDTLCYILCEENFMRLTPSAQVFASGSLAATSLATPAGLTDQTVYTSFSDAVVSGKFALLATDSGLLRVGSGKNISSATGQNFIDWTVVALPETAGPVSRLFVISPTGFESDCATDERGGNIYVLNAYVGGSQARVYRLAITPLTQETDEVSATTCQLFNDFFVAGKGSFYFNRGDYRNYCVTDGTLLFMSRCRYYPDEVNPFLEIIGPTQRTAVRSAQRGSFKVATLPEGYQMGKIIHRSALGSWMVPGSQMRVGW